MSITKGRAVTISDVAQTAGVSRAAVSKVIRNAYGVSPGMRERVEAAIGELGYRPSVAARAMRGASYRLGLEIPYLSAFMNQIVEGAKLAVAGTPYQLMLTPAEGIEYSAIESLADGIVDGIIAVSPLVDPAWLEDLASRVPVVMLGRHDDPAGYDTVVGDDHAGTRAVMDHLFTLGHRRIAHLTETESVTRHSSGTPHAIRLEVYRTCMTEAGLESLIEVARRPQTSRAETRAATDRLLALPDPPTAIFAGHDDIAVEVLARVTETGHRDRVSVAGYDDTDLAAHPLIDLTSIDQQGVEMGRQAASMLLERLAGRADPRHHIAATTLRARGSTRPVSS
ncbi:LacI family DNA-binding transcriptional regulator [Actinoplanes derwentensis]|uniref:Transcriptional regulator, LacI family n=1 Tax=Actinoplanes derwentensis TaxID=113562 RepID=A0A1H1TKP1_9ACTN|nr:LacI family DNA-binding transcriptional regulator [Actinoplanes derwentensis]GID85054.1 LacI family transcriptional regulator [Actinoplanes derwentensis]SDS60546.1 transcriptional regulator, LacI family [Actinoplanes derwentensis]